MASWAALRMGATSSMRIAEKNISIKAGGAFHSVARGCVTPFRSG